MEIISVRYPNVETKKAMTLLTVRLETIESQLANVEASQSAELLELQNARKELKELRGIVEPVISLAQAKFPDKDTGDAISLLVKRIQELESQVAGVEEHQKNEVEKHKNLQILMQTPPEVNAHLRPTNEGKYVVTIESANLVPFLAKWSVVTKNNKLLSGFMMSYAKFYPTENQNSWNYKIDISTKEIIENFAEFRFRFRSAFYDRMGKPDNLKGEVIRKYNMSTTPPFLDMVSD